MMADLPNITDPLGDVVFEHLPGGLLASLTASTPIAFNKPCRSLCICSRRRNLTNSREIGLLTPLIHAHQ
jgi:hypothetical protein